MESSLTRANMFLLQRRLIETSSRGFLDKYGINVSILNIAQINDKVGLEERKNYNRNQERASSCLTA